MNNATFPIKNLFTQLFFLLTVLTVPSAYAVEDLKKLILFLDGNDRSKENFSSLCSDQPYRPCSEIFADYSASTDANDIDTTGKYSKVYMKCKFKKKNCVIKEMEIYEKKQIEKFEKEVAILQSVQGIGVAPQIYDHQICTEENNGAVNLKALIMMEKMDGSLANFRKEGKDIDISELKDQIQKKLKLIHGKKIVHRDIHPGNILIKTGKKGKVNFYLNDFGLSHKFNSEDDQATLVKNFETNLTMSTMPALMEYDLKSVANLHRDREKERKWRDSWFNNPNKMNLRLDELLSQGAWAEVVELKLATDGGYNYGSSSGGGSFPLNSFGQLSSAKSKSHSYLSLLENVPAIQGDLYSLFLQKIVPDLNCPNSVSEWDKFKAAYLQNNIQKTYFTNPKNNLPLPFFNELAMDYCLQHSPLSKNPQWNQCTQNLRNFLSNIKGEYNPPVYDHTEYLKVFTDPVYGSILNPNNESDPIAKFLLSMGKKVTKADARTWEDIEKLTNESQTKAVQQLRQELAKMDTVGAIKVDQSKLSIFTTTTMVNVAPFKKAGRLIITYDNGYCINEYQVVLVDPGHMKQALDQVSSTDAKKQLMKDYRRPGQEFDRIIKCKKDPKTGMDLPEPIIFGEQFHRVVESDKLILTPQKATAACAVCHFDSYIPIYKREGGDPNSVYETDPENAKNLELTHEMVKKYNGNSPHPVWASSPKFIDPNQRVPMDQRLDNPSEIGPELGFTGALKSKASIEKILDICLPSPTKVEIREKVGKYMQCATCHKEGHPLAKPLQMRLPPLFGKANTSTHQRLRVLLGEKGITSNFGNKISMPPIRKTTPEDSLHKALEEDVSSVLRQCLTMAYYGRFLFLEPAIKELNFSSSQALLDSAPSILGQWLESPSCQEQR